MPVAHAVTRLAAIPASPNTEPSRACPVCGAAGTVPHAFSRGRWQVGRCRGCGMIYLRNPPPQSALANEFAWEHTREKERSRRRQRRGLYYFFSDALKRLKYLLRRGGRTELRLIRQLSPETGSVLDIGCANGGTLRPLAETARRLFGIEPSPGLARASDELCRRHGGRVEATTALEGLPRFAAGSMDLVVMRSYLEHETEPARVLREVVRVLKPGGWALIKVPNAACWSARLRGANWPGVRHPDHVNYFTPAHLRRLARECGFGRCHFLPASLLPTADNVWLRARAGTP